MPPNHADRNSRTSILQSPVQPATSLNAVRLPIPDLTLIIPSYNEEQRLPRTLNGVRDFFEEWGIDYRVLVADDGSSDRTPHLTESFGERFSTISLTRQRGKGAAVRCGMLQATGRVLAFTDADLPFDLEALRAGYEKISTGGCDVVFGARDLESSADLVPRKLSRKIASGTFSWIVTRLISRHVTDTQCGLKLFSPDAARAIFSRLRIEGFAFDAEIVYLTHRLKLSYLRVPVKLVNEHSSTLSLTRHALPMLRDIISLRWRAGWESARPTFPESDRPPEFHRPGIDTERHAA
jgi:dolichyl-phosphate beta-glucosyltransferase